MLELRLLGLHTCTGTPGWWLQHLKSALNPLLSSLVSQDRPNLALKPHGSLLKQEHSNSSWKSSVIENKVQIITDLSGFSRPAGFHCWRGFDERKKFQSMFNSKCGLNRYLVMFWKVNTIQCITWPLLFQQAAVASIFKFDSVSAAAPSKSD